MKPEQIQARVREMVAKNYNDSPYYRDYSPEYVDKLVDKETTLWHNFIIELLNNKEGK